MNVLKRLVGTQHERSMMLQESNSAMSRGTGRMPPAKFGEVLQLDTAVYETVWLAARAEMTASALLPLLMLLSVAAAGAQTETSCTFNLRGLTLSASTGSTAGRASIACTGATLKLTVAPALRSFVDGFIGVPPGLIWPGTEVSPIPAMGADQGCSRACSSITSSSVRAPFTHARCCAVPAVQLDSLRERRAAGSKAALPAAYQSFCAVMTCASMPLLPMQPGTSRLLITYAHTLSDFHLAGVTATLDAAATSLVTLSDASVTITGSSFSNLDGGQAGSVLSFDGGSVALEQTTFSGCSAAGPGNSVLAVSGATLTVSASSFTGNYADSYGGAIGASDSSLHISGSRWGIIPWTQEQKQCT